MGLLFFLPAALSLVEARGSVAKSFLYGICFSTIGYGCLMPWLGAYDPLAPSLVLSVSAIQYGILFAVLGLALERHPQGFGYFAPLAWTGLEYAKTLGALGLPYGIIGYSQSDFISLAQSASVAGVFGVSFLALLPSSFVVGAWKAGQDSKGLPLPIVGRTAPRFAYAFGLIILLLAAGVGSFSLRHGRPNGFQEPTRRLRIGLVQPNIPPEESGLGLYAKSAEFLTQESARLIVQGAELVVWPETAFVPSLLWPGRRSSGPEVGELVGEVREFFRSSGIDFLVGNNHAEEEPGIAGSFRCDYNAAILFRAGQDVPQIYRKTKLVPFSEYFPYSDSLPALAWRLELRAGGFWRPGPAPHTLILPGDLKIGSPICYEDGFGWLVRGMVRDGACLILVLANDAWARSEAAERLHLAMSVFRAIENRRPVLRTTNSGITASIDPYGRIVAELPSGLRGGLIVDQSVRPSAPSFYTIAGDWFGQACLGIGLGVLAALAVGRLSLGSKPKA